MPEQRTALTGRKCNFFLSHRADENSGLLVANISSEGLFRHASHPREAFDRACHVALSVFDRSVVIPTQWRKWTQDQRLSIFASSRRTSEERMYFHRRPKDTKAVYVYALTVEPLPFESVHQDRQIFWDAYETYADALLAQPLQQSDADGEISRRHQVVLTESLGGYTAQGVGLKDWRDNKLTAEQRTFVEKDYTSPVRLRGAAGTGKTLAMAVKFLSDAYKFEDAGLPTRMAFLTHSWATLRQVHELLMQLDDRRLWERWKHVKITLWTLYDLANELLRYDFEEVTPLHTDGVAGRQMQMELISGVLDSFRKNSFVQLEALRRCSPAFCNRVTSMDTNVRHPLIRDLMNEFSNVLDAEKIRLGSKAADTYLAGKREAWQMLLERQEDRELVLRLHDAYCKELEECNVLSLDQMISDLNLHLSSYAWNRICEHEGYDVIFVDEFHLFTRAERMALHGLVRDRANKALPLFMSYDLRQSPYDTFYEIRKETGSTVFHNIGPGELVKLTKVFRFTPEIAEFLVQLDSGFPAADLPSEWGDYVGVSERTPGETPELWVFRSNALLMRHVFDDAKREARRRGGRKVAVLCVSEDMFEKYLHVGHLQDKRIDLTSREQVPELRYAGRRFIFSHPQYVAGLQFETVYLIHADKEDLDERGSIGQKRRLVSQIYLGAGRAEQRLIIACSEERRGPAAVFDVAVQSGALHRCNMESK